MSVTIFQVFSCHNVGSHDQEDSYMAADHRVSCDSERYLFAFWWAIAMVFVYPVGKYNSLFFINVGWTYTMYVCIFYMTNVYTGIPLLYFCILRVSRVRNKNSGIPIEVINMLCEDFTDQYWYESWRTECDVLLFVIDECWQRHLLLSCVSRFWTVVDAVYRVVVTVSVYGYQVYWTGSSLPFPCV